MKVGVDVDGVLYPFAERVREWCSARTGRDLPAADGWDFFAEQWGMTKREFWQHVDDGVAAQFIYAAGNPEVGALASLKMLRKMGHSVHICTARRRGEAETMLWLRHNKMPFDSVTFSADKTLLDVDVFVDDNVENWREVRDAGRALSLLFDQPWNRDADEAGDLRVVNWSQVVTFVDCLDVLREAA